MLTYNPANRISADEALNHIWIKTKVNEPIDSKATISALNNLRTFRVKHYCLSYIGRIKDVISCNYFYCELTGFERRDE